MTERRWTMAEITRACDAPFAEALKQPNTDRALRLFVQGLIDNLKALPDEGEARTAPRLPQKSDL